MANQPTDEPAHVLLEILANWIYLTKQEAKNAENVVGYMTTAEEQVFRLAANWG
jgi:hypothetical protein